MTRPEDQGQQGGDLNADGETVPMTSVLGTNPKRSAHSLSLLERCLAAAILRAPTYSSAQSFSLIAKINQ